MALLNFRDWARNLSSAASDSDANGDAAKKQSVTLLNSVNIRIVLSIIYTIVETVRDGCQSANVNRPIVASTATMAKPPLFSSLDHTAKLREQLIEELGRFD